MSPWQDARSNPPRRAYAKRIMSPRQDARSNPPWRAYAKRNCPADPSCIGNSASTKRQSGIIVLRGAEERGTYLMRIPASVMADLRAQFSPDEANVWTTAWDCLPDSVMSLALAGKTPIRKAYAACKKMTASGWMPLRGRGRELHPIALIPHVSQEKTARVLVLLG